MNIDWFTFAAQIVNFLILVWLLKRLLYKPIIHMMEEREKRIGTRMEEADERVRVASREQAKYEEELSEFREKRQELFSQASEEAEQTRRELLRKARSDADKAREQWHTTVEREKDAFLQSFRSQASKATFAAATRILRELADSNLEALIVRNFAGKLREGADESWDELADSVATSSEGLRIRTAFELGDDERAELTSLIEDQLGEGVPLAFEIDEQLICGVELSTAGVKMSWNIQSHVDDVQAVLAEIIEQEAGDSSVG